MAKQIPLSFKDNKEENEMYDFLKNKSSPSAFVKDLVKMYMDNENAFTTPKVIKQKIKKEESSIKGSSLKSLQSLLK